VGSIIQLKVCARTPCAVRVVRGALRGSSTEGISIARSAVETKLLQAAGSVAMARSVRRSGEKCRVGGGCACGRERAGWAGLVRIQGLVMTSATLLTVVGRATVDSTKGTLVRCAVPPSREAAGQTSHAATHTRQREIDAIDLSSARSLIRVLSCRAFREDTAQCAQCPM
jgi:hypothetical protein